MPDPWSLELKLLDPNLFLLNSVSQLLSNSSRQYGFCTWDSAREYGSSDSSYRWHWKHVRLASGRTVQVDDQRQVSLKQYLWLVPSQSTLENLKVIIQWMRGCVGPEKDELLQGRTQDSWSLATQCRSRIKSDRCNSVLCRALGWWTLAM